MRLEDRELVRGYPDADPVVRAVMWNRIFGRDDYTEIWVDGLPPTALLAIAPSRRSDGSTGFALHAENPAAAEALLPKVPTGEVFFHLSSDALYPLVEGRAETIDAPAFWLYRMDPGDFRDQQRHEVRPVTEEWAPVIAKLWEPDWPSEGYVRRRILDGPTAGVYVDGDLVAWNMTHFETSRVVMFGFLHTKEAHRGKGYGGSASSALAKGVLARGKIPACHVRWDNAPSIALTEGLGFRKVRRQVWGDAVLRR